MGKKKVMIVDDEPNLVEMVKVLLENDGYSVVTAYSGDECLKMLRKEKVDLILLDIMMPRMDGWMVCRKLKAKKATKDIPVIMLTAKVSTIDKDIGLDVAGIDDYVTKPFVPEELVERVRKTIG